MLIGRPKGHVVLASDTAGADRFQDILRCVSSERGVLATAMVLPGVSHALDARRVTVFNGQGQAGPSHVDGTARSMV